LDDLFVLINGSKSHSVLVDKKIGQILGYNFDKGCVLSLNISFKMLSLSYPYLL